MAAAMGLRMDREKFKQQKQRDVINEMYQTEIMNKMKGEAKRLERTIPYEVDGKHVLVNQAEYIKLKQLENSAKGGLQKEYEFYAAQVEAQGGTPMGLEDFMASKNTWIQQYKYYAMQQIRMGQPAKDFDQWAKEIRRASALTFPQEAEKAGAVTGARETAKAEQELLGTGLRKRARENLEADNKLFLAEPGEEEKLVAGEMEQLLVDQFGSDNVQRWTNDAGKKGWRVRKSDGTYVFKER